MAVIVPTGGMRHSAESVLAAAGAVLLHGLALWLVFQHETDSPIVEPRILTVSLLAAPAPPAPAPPVAQPAQPAPAVAPMLSKPAKATPQRAVKRPLAPTPRTVESTTQAEPVTTPAPIARSAPANAVAAPPTPQTPPGEMAAPLVAPRFDAAYLNNPPPPYPPLSRRLGEQGRVMVRVFVDPNGAPAQIELRESSGHPRLDDAAALAVRRWRFVPARRGTEPVGAWVLVPISFNLRS